MNIKRLQLNILGLLCLLILTVSCTKHREQYPFDSNINLDNTKQPLLLTSKEKHSNKPHNGVVEEANSQLAHDSLNSQKTAQETYKKIRQNASLPIDYENQSAGGIDMNQNLKNLSSILHPDRIENTYNAGLNIRFEEEQITRITISSAYKGFLDFGPEIGKKRVGDSFANQFNLKTPIQKDLKNQSFIRSIFNHFEKTNVDCFSLNQCKSFFSDSMFFVDLPKMELIFGTDERRTLLNIILKKEEPSKALAQINYQNRSIGDEEPVDDILRLSYFALLDFGPQAGIRKLLDSFSDVIDLTSIHPEKDVGVQNFIISLYNHLEETDINCLQEKLCHIEDNNQIVLRLPKIQLTFSKNRLAVLEDIKIIGKKAERIFKNRTVPFNYEKDFIANIDLQMEREEVEEILSGLGDRIDDVIHYEEGLRISWSENSKIDLIHVYSKQTLKKIFNEKAKKNGGEEIDEDDIDKLNLDYKGAFDFGPEIGSRTLGASFFDQFNLEPDPKEDQKAKDFIVSLYNLWEKSSINCLETKDCKIIVNEELIQFYLPKAILSFSNDFQRNFAGFTLNGLEIQKRERTIRENSRAVINPVEQSVANISMKMTKDKIEKKLHLLYTTFDGIFIYREGLGILWDETNQPRNIFVSPEFLKQILYRVASDSEVSNLLMTYQGAIDFGSDLKHIGDSFTNQFDLSSQNIAQDEKAKNFIVSIYNYLNNTEINCLETKKCNMKYTTPSNNILFELPTLNLVFTNNRNRTFHSLVFKKN